MFERYTQGARRVIFLARQEAMQCGCAYIEVEHLLLAILRDDPNLPNPTALQRSSVESIRKEIENKAFIGPPIAEPFEVTFSDNSKRVLNLAAEEDDEVGRNEITPTHLIIGILRLNECIAAKVLEAHGFTVPIIRQEMRGGSRFY